jgi:hypothetical protein
MDWWPRETRQLGTQAIANRTGSGSRSPAVARCTAKFGHRARRGPILAGHRDSYPDCPPWTTRPPPSPGSALSSCTPHTGEPSVRSTQWLTGVAPSCCHIVDGPGSQRHGLGPEPAFDRRCDVTVVAALLGLLGAGEEHVTIRGRRRGHDGQGLDLTWVPAGERGGHRAAVRQAGSTSGSPSSPIEPGAGTKIVVNVCGTAHSLVAPSGGSKCPDALGGAREGNV